ncbi:ATPase AAA [Bifidobacterium margollesii]|uniref:ATPase AAA n=2 Tax=Bifidobacterium margollesii TaxID=2020964 RepID=A0A2N5JCB7_9BIFI|nr:ATPase AAA [Bifidobacterium margollesii]
MYIRKQNYYSERRIFRYVTPFDLRSDLIANMRKMAATQRSGHPWGRMSDDEMFRSAKLYNRDYVTGEEGFNLAAVLLLGKDDVISSVCPAYVTDAIVQRNDVDRYDDRLMARTNLFDSYEHLVDFVQRNLPDRFALDSGKRTSPRDIIARELVSNSLMHREYSSPVIARIVMDRESIRTINASRSFFEGRMRLGDFTSMPKNPIIADVFVQTGLAEKLGSGLHNLIKASELYTGREPEFSDGDLFRAMVPTAVGYDASEATQRSHDAAKRPTVEPSYHERLAQIIDDELQRHTIITAPQIARISGFDVRTVRAFLNRLVDQGELAVEGRTRGRRYRRM